MLEQDVEDLASVIARAPKARPFSVDPADHVIRMPTRRRRPPPLLQSPADQEQELDRPAEDRPTAGVNSAGGHHLLRIAQAQAEAEIKADRVTDHVGWKTMALERDRFHESDLRQRLVPDFTGDLLAFA